MDRVVIYARVSTNKQDFERQVQDLKNYAEKCQYVIVDIIAETQRTCQTEKV
jgi:predicted site-specific integrase-resolvase